MVDTEEVPCYNTGIVTIPSSSHVSDVRAFASRSARASFAYFVRHCFGHRKVSEEHLEAVACGAVVPSSFEQKLLDAWEGFKQGTVPPSLAWLLSAQTED